MSDSNGLPTGWCEATVADIAVSMKNGIYKKKEFYADDGVPCLRMYNINDGRLIWRDLKHMTLDDAEVAEFGLSPGDLLVNRVNSRELVGKTCVIPDGTPSCVFESKNIRLIVREANPKYVNYRLLLEGRKYFSKNLQQTVGMASISQSQLGAFPIPIAPLDEQNRIVAKIEELFSDLDAGVAALERAKANLKRYRAAVLKAAVEGNLTKEWRSENPDVEPASELLERILAERRERWEAEELAKYEEKGKKPPKGWKEKYKEPAEPDVEGLPELPDGWCWATVGQIGRIVTGSTPSKRQSDNFGGEIPFVKPTDLNVGYNVHSSIDTLTQLGAAQSRMLPARTPLVTCIGATIGKTGMARVECATNQQINAVVVEPIGSFPEWVYWVIISPFGQNWITSHASATTLPILNKGKFENCPIPLPPLDEIEIAVTGLEQIDSVREKLESQLDTSGQRSARLRQSILKRAFEGKLVPQDPNDEPASELLARIKAERVAAEANGKKTRTRRVAKVRAKKR